MKRGTDHNWRIVKYKGDVAIYALCRCGFSNEVSMERRDEDGWMPPKEANPSRLYRYCPLCGARKKTYTPDVEKINRFRPGWEFMED